MTNTPWGARVRFAFDPTGETVNKALHVSPFMDMESSWTLQSDIREEHLTLTVRAHHPEMGPFFDAILHVKRSAQQGRSERCGLRTLLKSASSSQIREGCVASPVQIWISAASSGLLDLLPGVEAVEIRSAFLWLPRYSDCAQESRDLSRSPPHICKWRAFRLDRSVVFSLESLLMTIVSLRHAQLSHHE